MGLLQKLFSSHAKNKGMGHQAEIAALQYLKKHGLTLIVSNYRCRFGEIDLILQEQEALVFVEVRLRKHVHFGGASASVTAPKQYKIIKTALDFLQKHSQYKDAPCRFDVIAMTDLENIEWIKNAFQIQE